MRQGAALRKRVNQRRWPDRFLAKLEQNMMIGFYSIRKLLEAKKLTIDVVKRSIPATAFPWRGEPVNHLNWHNIDQLYDFERLTIKSDLFSGFPTQLDTVTYSRLPLEKPAVFQGYQSFRIEPGTRPSNTLSLGIL